MRLLLLITNLISIILLIITTQLTSLFVLPPPLHGTQHVHKTLLLDRRFSQEEVELITIAAIEWTEATNHIVEIDIIQLPNQNEILNDNIIIVNSASPDNPDILIQEDLTKHVILGLYTHRNGVDIIELVSDRIKDHQYKAIVLHEIGHALGLGHNDGLEGINTLMYPYIDLGANYITPDDIKNFCKLYRCSQH